MTVVKLSLMKNIYLQKSIGARKKCVKQRLLVSRVYIPAELRAHNV
jgi:hypothetical protein